MPQIPAEAIEKYRRLELRSMTASAAAQALAERVNQLRHEEGDLLTSLQHAYHRAGDGRIEIADDGRVTFTEPTVEHDEYITGERSHTQKVGGRTRVLAECDPTAVRLVKTRAAIADTVQRRDAASEAAKPLNGLRTACAEHLKSLGWEDI